MNQTAKHDYTVSEVAKELHYSAGTIKNWIKSGRITARKFGRDYRIPWAEVERIKSEIYSPETKQAL